MCPFLLFRDSAYQVECFMETSNYVSDWCSFRLFQMFLKLIVTQEIDRAEQTLEKWAT